MHKASLCFVVVMYCSFPPYVWWLLCRYWGNHIYSVNQLELNYTTTLIRRFVQTDVLPGSHGLQRTCNIIKTKLTITKVCTYIMGETENIISFRRNSNHITILPRKQQSLLINLLTKIRRYSPHKRNAPIMSMQIMLIQWIGTDELVSMVNLMKYHFTFMTTHAILPACTTILISWFSRMDLLSNSACYCLFLDNNIQPKLASVSIWKILPIRGSKEALSDMKLIVHSLTSTVQPLKLRNGQVISSHT